MIQIVAVVDAGSSTTTIWHVDIGSEVPGMSRFCGAWVLNDEPHTVELLTRHRLIVATRTGQTAMQSARATPAGTLDLARTVNVIAAERDRLQQIYDTLPASRKKTLVAPRWPHIPDPVDLNDPPLADGAAHTVATALGIARHLDQLATVWSDVEKQRIARKYLTEHTPDKPADARDLAAIVAATKPM